MTDDEGLKSKSGEGAAIGLTKLQFAGLPSEADKDAALELAISDLVRKDARNPVVRMESMGAPTKRGTGWADAPKIAPPPGIKLIDQIVDALAGPAFRKKAEDR